MLCLPTDPIQVAQLDTAPCPTSKPQTELATFMDHKKLHMKMNMLILRCGARASSRVEVRHLDGVRG